jgi:outer membrane protein TolC
MSSIRLCRWWLPGLFAAGLGALSLGAQPPDKEAPLPPPRKLPGDRAGGEPEKPTEPVKIPGPPASILDPETRPIDLRSALKLAGVDNPEILLARQRVGEAVALRQLAAVQILPNLNAGTNFDSHTGNLQQSDGNILSLNRSALSAGLGTGAVAAGTVPIPGLLLQGNISEGIFGYLVSKQVVREREFDSIAVRNNVLLQVASAYVDLLYAEGHRAIALKTRGEAAEVARVTAEYAVTGQGKLSDADRAAADLAQRDEEILQAENEVLLASARLCQVLNLDPSVRLFAADGWVVPAPLVPEPIPLPLLIATALMQRPELAAQRAAIREAFLVLHGAKVLPFSPNVILGYSSDTFGGGSNLISRPGGFVIGTTSITGPRFGDFHGREDVDAVVYWTLRNLGLGNVALVKAARARLDIAKLREIVILDRVRTEVAAAYARTHARFAQIAIAERAVETSQQGFTLDLRRTRGNVGLPIEVLDNLRLLGRARLNYLQAISDYNRAQFELYVALGQPPADVLARAIPASLVPPPPEPGACPPPAPVTQTAHR